MTESFCGYDGDRDDALMSCLYKDGDAGERARFDAHLVGCARCHDELASLRGVRTQLARWAPPEPAFSLDGPQSSIRNPQSAIAWWRQVPVWAQVAAALLFLGVSAALANLDVRYDASGLRVRTGWMQAAADNAAPARQTTIPVLASGTGTAPWRADLVALEQQLKAEMHSAQVSAAPVAQRAVSAADADLMRRLRVLIDDSEKRQQRELALRVAEMMRDIAAQRRADLVNIDRTLGVVQNNLGVEVAKDRERLNLLYRASLRQ